MYCQISWFKPKSKNDSLNISDVSDLSKTGQKYKSQPLLYKCIYFSKIIQNTVS